MNVRKHSKSSQDVSIIEFRQHAMAQTRVLMMTELVQDSGSDERLQLTEIRVFDDVRVVFEEVGTIFFWMEARRSCVALESAQAMVT